MKRLNILHISDSHIQKKDKSEIKYIVQELINDIKKVQEQKGISIDLICFTGDLIQRGDKALQDENQWGLAMEILVEPLLSELGLSMDRFIVVPGNHEVDITKIIPALESGLQVKTLDKINPLLDAFDPIYRSRLDYFYENIKENQSDVKFATLGYSYNKEINGLNVGVVCVDSAWRSSGKGYVEKGNLYIGSRQIKDLYSHVENSDIKICMMHHPIDWLEDCETLEVEKDLAKFDIVMRGHVHVEDLKQVIRKNLKTVYSTAGKLYPLDYAEGRAIDGYNGYSIINVEYDMHKCIVLFRTYYAQNRKEFDIGTNICPNGEEYFDMFSDSDSWKEKFSIINGINQYFSNMSEKYAMIKEVDSKSPKEFKQILFEPVLSDKSEYVKENEHVDEKETNIQNIMGTDENILLIGKKETGKTTVLQQIGLLYISEFETRNMIPVHVNMKYLSKGQDRILNSTIHFIQDNILGDDAISKNKILELITAGKMVFLIDNVKTSDSNHTLWITRFIEAYKNNRFILTIEEEFFQSVDVKKIPDYGTVFREVYIQYMGKAQIRAMVTNWAKGREDLVNIDDTVNNIDSYCNQINFAKTPFNIAVFMILWDNDNNFVPTNEGIVMQNYLQIVLEKLSPKEALRSTYSFTLKEHFLSNLAYCMYEKNEYYLTKDEFDKWVKEYHTLKGHNLGESKFDTLFFDKNILSYSGDYILFSHTSFQEYFLACYAQKNKAFLDEITKKGNRINFRNEICFYSGLNQDCKELLGTLSMDIMGTVVDYIDLVDSLNEMQITTEFRMDREQLLADIQKNRLTQDELDDVSDRNNIYIEKKPTELGNHEVQEGDAEDFFVILQMYGSIIKNAELIDNKDKVEHLEYYLYGMYILYAMMVKLFENMEEDFKFEELSPNDRKHFNIENEEDFEKIKPQLVDVTKLVLPIAIQNMILENVGTPKLEAAINVLIRSRNDKSFEKFMLTFLKCDLKIVNLKDFLGKYIRNEESKDILKIALMKLTFYYRGRFFGNNIQVERELIDLIADIHMKLNPQKYQNFYKSEIAKNLKFQLDH